VLLDEGLAIPADRRIASLYGRHSCALTLHFLFPATDDSHMAAQEQ